MQTAMGVDYGYLRDLVFSYSQNVLDASRDYLFDTRLTTVLRSQGMTRLDELVFALRLRKDTSLERAIAEAMTINETSFFRDSRPFELLRTDLLPKLIEARRYTRSLRFWSAACSTGQEAYSLAMLVRDSFPQLNAWSVRIEGTDICSEVVERANSLKFGLAAYAFTSSAQTATAIGDALESGMVGVNSVMISTPETPFGGVKESGYGHEGGIEDHGAANYHLCTGLRRRRRHPTGALSES